MIYKIQFKQSFQNTRFEIHFNVFLRFDLLVTCF